MSRPQNIFWTLPWPDHSPLRPKKRKNGPKIKSNSNVRIEGIIENKSCSITWVDRKTVFEPYPEPKNSPNRAKKKVRNDPKIKSKQEGAELCQAQPAKHKLFGSNGAIFFWFGLLMVVLLNCWIDGLLNCWFVELLNG